MFVLSALNELGARAVIDFKLVLALLQNRPFKDRPPSQRPTRDHSDSFPRTRSLRPPKNESNCRAPIGTGNCL